MPHYENVPFNVPDNWIWTTVEEILELVSGQDFPPEKYNNNVSGVPYIIGASNIENEQLVINRWTEFPSVFSYINDLLVVCKGAGVGKMAINNIGTAHIARQIQAVRAYTNYINIKYIKAVVKHNIEDIISKANGLIPGLKRELLLSLQIPLPPFSEQQRIIIEMEHLFTLIDKVEENKYDLQAIIKQAKNKILDLAIQGKLVQQDLNEEPASELLKRINPKAEITCDNGQYGKRPFEIPNSWCWSRLGDINNIARGGSPRPIKDYLTDDKNGINWIKIGDTTREGKYIDSVKEKIRPEGMKKSRFVHKGDFLLTNSMSFGRPYILNVDGCIHDGWLVISPIGEVYTSDFLYHLLSSSFAFEQFTNVASGGVVTNLNSDKVADTIFPVPPLAEQQRIVAKIEKLFEQLDYIENSLEA
ncbi:restriction endonuclease subunit S [Bacteroides caecigallinarum]|mgnify:FL=1|uniref:restriction endonuclease subunit S n=1 Tax=Bacteroides caecigallinarum TaxID=1411144 RepID=UPI0004685D81|nr:restriction endonuclease subunit S [Bacteroides caecigallinarum]MBM6961140.1 restriction endonuclease subunit S [Bacteroides caecigallinarum]